jgi:hypothetical protein
MLFKKKSLAAIMGRMPAACWKYLATDMPDWIQGTVEVASRSL